MTNQYGPQTAQIEALIDRARCLTEKETVALRDAWDARYAWAVGRGAGRYPAWAVAHDAAWVAAWDAWDDGSADWDAAWYATRDAVQALVVRDLIGQHGFAQEHFDTLVAPWESVMGTEWTREATYG